MRECQSHKVLPGHIMSQALYCVIGKLDWPNQKQNTLEVSLVVGDRSVSRVQKRNSPMYPYCFNHRFKLQVNDGIKGVQVQIRAVESEAGEKPPPIETCDFSVAEKVINCRHQLKNVQGASLQISLEVADSKEDPSWFTTTKGSCDNDFEISRSSSTASFDISGRLGRRKTAERSVEVIFHSRSSKAKSMRPAYFSSEMESSPVVEQSSVVSTTESADTESALCEKPMSDKKEEDSGSINSYNDQASTSEESSSRSSSASLMASEDEGRDDGDAVVGPAPVLEMPSLAGRTVRKSETDRPKLVYEIWKSANNAKSAGQATAKVLSDLKVADVEMTEDQKYVFVLVEEAVAQNSDVERAVNQYGAAMVLWWKVRNSEQFVQWANHLMNKIADRLTDLAAARMLKCLDSLFATTSAVDDKSPSVVSLKTLQNYFPAKRYAQNLWGRVIEKVDCTITNNILATPWTFERVITANNHLRVLTKNNLIFRKFQQACLAVIGQQMFIKDYHQLKQTVPDLSAEFIFFLFAAVHNPVADVGSEDMHLFAANTGCNVPVTKQLQDFFQVPNMDKFPLLVTHELN